jgi:hypothetical protein
MDEIGSCVGCPTAQMYSQRRSCAAARHVRYSCQSGWGHYTRNGLVRWFGAPGLLLQPFSTFIYRRHDANCQLKSVSPYLLDFKLTMPGRLKVQRPSPTTVSFTVSNAPQRSSSPAKILFGLQILLRAVLFSCVVSVGVALLRHIVFKGDSGRISWSAVWSSALGSKLCRFVDSYNPLAIAVVSAVVIYGVFRRGYTGELNITEWN